MKHLRFISKILLFFSLSLIVATLSFFIFIKIYSNFVSIDSQKLINLESSTTFLDENNNVIDVKDNSTSVCFIEEINNNTKNAFIAIEDKRFYSHKGIDYQGMLRAVLSNIKNFSFKEGGSTITQQLAKNTFLSNDKSIKRKIKEMILAKKIEKNYSKDKILEMYLNTIYFGDNCYGISKASKKYFDKKVSELTLAESAVLASIIKSPKNYSPTLNYENNNKRKNLVLSEMLTQNYISQEEYEEAKNQRVEIKNKDFHYNYLNFVNEEFDEIIAQYNLPYSKYKVITYFDQKAQEQIEKEYNSDNLNCEKSAILLNDKNHVSAYFSTTKQTRRQMGSTIKPLLVYSPNIEQNNVDICTKVLDEKTNFNGYTPSNYNDKYYGYISVSDALSKSSNVCTVKLLNQLGINKCKKYINKTDITLSEKDNSLCIGLGCTEKGATLTEISSAYGIYTQNGLYYKPHAIKKIINEKGTVVYENKEENIKVFSSDTVYLTNVMLNNCVKNGTAKKLSFVNENLCAKTGTVGFDNYNTDAYCISYNTDYVLGVWYGNKLNNTLDNSVTGGSYPTILASKIWKGLYQNNFPDFFKMDNSVKEVSVDKISYDKENKIEVADNIAPEKYTKKFLFRSSNIPKNKSLRFTSPIVNEMPKITLNSNGLSIQLCLTEYYEAQIIRQSENKTECIYDTFNNDKTIFTDNSFESNKRYTYYLLPYYIKDKKYFGEKKLICKIKTPTTSVGEKWWTDDEYLIIK